MPSDIGADELVKFHPIFKAGMMQRALYGCSELDIRTVTILQKHGLLTKVLPNPLPEDIIDILMSPAHPRRIASPPGPLVFVREGETEHVVMRVPEFMLSHKVEVRRAVLQFFESLTGAFPQVLTPKTKTVLAQHSEDVCSSNPKKWQVAALAIADRLNDDFLCNLACVRQCLARRYDQGIIHYLSLVLQPTLSSLDSIEFHFPTPSRQVGELLTFVQDVVNTAETLSDAIDRYYEACGHIPLAESVSAGRIIREWALRYREDKTLWEQVWRWAERKGSPLARYHICQAFSVNPALVLVQDISMLWRELANIIHAPYTENAEDQWTEAWRLRCELARHYVQTIECQWSGQESERLAAFAWWMAETVAAVFGVSSNLLKHIRERVVAPAEEHSRYIWQLARPPVQPSTLRYATVLTKSLWSLALQCQIGPLIQQHTANQIESPARSIIQKAIEANVLQLFPPNSPDSIDPVYAYEKAFMPTVKAWLDTMTTGNDRDRLAACVDANERLLQIDRLGEHLDRFTEASEADQLLLALTIRLMAYLGNLPLEVMWERLTNDAWRSGVLLKGNLQAVELLFDAWAETQIHYGDKWRSHLSHYYAIACEDAQGESARQELLFACTVISSLMSDTVSGLDRLLRGKNKWQFVNSVSDWRTNLGRCQTVATPWIAARIRAVLASLRVVG